jgi:hypothetical protein
MDFIVTSILIFIVSIFPTALGQNVTENIITVEELSNTINNFTSDLPPGIPMGEYRIYSNGLQGIFNITSIDDRGFFKGILDLYPHDKKSDIQGYFNNTLNKITFNRTPLTQQTDIEQYIGYKFTNIIANCISGTGPGSCFQYTTFAGTFNSTQTNQTYGWYASHTPEPCPDCPT